MLDPETHKRNNFSFNKPSLVDFNDGKKTKTQAVKSKYIVLFNLESEACLNKSESSQAFLFFTSTLIVNSAEEKLRLLSTQRGDHHKAVSIKQQNNWQRKQVTAHWQGTKGILFFFTIKKQFWQC